MQDSFRLISLENKNDIKFRSNRPQFQKMLIALVLVLLLQGYGGLGQRAEMATTDVTHCNSNDGWLTSQEQCLFIGNVSKNWTAAQDDCMARHSHLATFPSEIHNQILLIKLSPVTPYWIGYHYSRSDPEGLNGTTTEGSTRFQQISTSDNCGSVMVTGNETHRSLIWHLADCTLLYLSVCMINLQRQGMIALKQAASNSSNKALLPEWETKPTQQSRSSDSILKPYRTINSKQYANNVRDIPGATCHRKYCALPYKMFNSPCHKKSHIPCWRKFSTPCHKNSGALCHQGKYRILDASTNPAKAFSSFATRGRHKSKLSAALLSNSGAITQLHAPKFSIPPAPRKLNFISKVGSLAIKEISSASLRRDAKPSRSAAIPKIRKHLAALIGRQSSQNSLQTVSRYTLHTANVRQLISDSLAFALFEKVHDKYPINSWQDSPLSKEPIDMKILSFKRKKVKERIIPMEQVSQRGTSTTVRKALLVGHAFPQRKEIFASQPLHVEKVNSIYPNETKVRRPNSTQPTPESSSVLSENQTTFWRQLWMITEQLSRTTSRMSKEELLGAISRMSTKQLIRAISRMSTKQLSRIIIRMSTKQLSRAISRMSTKQLSRIIIRMSTKQLSRAIGRMSTKQSSQAIGRMSTKQSSRAIGRMSTEQLATSQRAISLARNNIRWRRSEVRYHTTTPIPCWICRHQHRVCDENRRYICDFHEKNLTWVATTPSRLSFDPHRELHSGNNTLNASVSILPLANLTTLSSLDLVESTSKLPAHNLSSLSPTSEYIHAVGTLGALDSETTETGTSESNEGTLESETAAFFSSSRSSTPLSIPQRLSSVMPRPSTAMRLATFHQTFFTDKTSVDLPKGWTTPQSIAMTEELVTSASDMTITTSKVLATSVKTTSGLNSPSSTAIVLTLEKTTADGPSSSTLPTPLEPTAEKSTNSRATKDVPKVLAEATVTSIAVNVSQGGSQLEHPVEEWPLISNETSLEEMVDFLQGRKCNVSLQCMSYAILHPELNADIKIDLLNSALFHCPSCIAEDGNQTNTTSLPFERWRKSIEHFFRIFNWYLIGTHKQQQRTNNSMSSELLDLEKTLLAMDHLLDRVVARDQQENSTMFGLFSHLEFQIQHLSTIEEMQQFHFQDRENVCNISHIDVVDYHRQPKPVKTVLISVVMHVPTWKVTLSSGTSEEESILGSSVLLLSGYLNGRPRSLRHSFSLRTLQNTSVLANGSSYQPQCAFLHQSSRSWSTYGCQVIDPSGKLITYEDGDRTVSCRCNHTSNFAILMQIVPLEVAGVHRVILSIITYIGCSITLITQIMAITVFTCIGSLNCERVCVHRNLCIAIVGAQVTFLAGIEAVQNRLVCAIVAVLLHYWYTAVFVWMLVEGLHLYSMVVRVFGTERSRITYYICFGWGMPLIMVTISAAADWKGYGTPTSCWLSIQRNTIWAFVGPAMAILIVNLVILAAVVKIVMASAKLDKLGEFDHIRAGVKATLMLLPLLGLTWVFGLAAVNKDLIIFQYLFALFNTLQGFFIFLFHCVFNSEVRQALKRLQAQRSLQRADQLTSSAGFSSSSSVSPTPSAQDSKKPLALVRDNSPFELSAPSAVPTRYSATTNIMSVTVPSSSISINRNRRSSNQTVRATTRRKTEELMFI